MIRSALLLLFCTGIATADEDSDPAPAFVTIERFDTASRVGLDFMTVENENYEDDSTFRRVDLHAHYIHRGPTGFGGYLQLPVTSAVWDGTHERESVFGHLRFGGLLAPARYGAFSLVFHAGVAVPIDDPPRVGNIEYDLASRAALVKPHEIYATINHTTAAEAGGSLLFRASGVIARVDVAIDMDGGTERYEATTSLVTNGGIGAVLTRGLTLGLEISMITRLTTPPYPVFELYWPNTKLLASGAVSLRYQLGAFYIYGAVAQPFREAQRAYVGRGITLGVEYAF